MFNPMGTPRGLMGQSPTGAMPGIPDFLQNGSNPQALANFLYQNNPNVRNVMDSMNGQNPQAYFQQQYQTNPQFRQFADSMQGLTPQQMIQNAIMGRFGQ